MLFSLHVSAGMLLAGFILRNIPVVTDAVYIDVRWSGSLRNIALAVILVKAGLELDGKVWNPTGPCRVTPKTLLLTREDVPSCSWEFSFSKTPCFFVNMQFHFTKAFHLTEDCISGSEEAQKRVFAFVHVPSHLRGNYYGCGLLFNIGPSMDLGLYFRVNHWFC